jgi:hypothetical protein
MREVGRPSEMSESKVKKLEEAAAMDCTIEEMCLYANISKTTYYNWLEKHPELVDRIEILRNEPFLLARQTIVKAIKENPQYAFEYMKRKKKNEFSDKQEIDMTSNGETIGVVILPKKNEGSLDSNG